MADDPTLAAVHGVAEDLRGLRVELTGRMDQMVTRREHEAEVRRIDSEAARVRDALDVHVTSSDRDRAAQAERRRTDRRFQVTTTIAAAGVASGIAGTVVGLIIR